MMPLKLQGVAGIGATLKAGYNIVTRSEDIDNLAFAFISLLNL